MTVKQAGPGARAAVIRGGGRRRGPVWCRNPSTRSGGVSRVAERVVASPQTGSLTGASSPAVGAGEADGWCHRQGRAAEVASSPPNSRKAPSPKDWPRKGSMARDDQTKRGFPVPGGTGGLAARSTATAMRPRPAASRPARATGRSAKARRLMSPCWSGSAPGSVASRRSRSARKGRRRPGAARPPAAPAGIAARCPPAAR